MNINRIAVSMPGKIGDALYALPVAMELCKRHGMTCHFYTSDYCLPLKRLFEYQSYIDEMIVPGAYKIDNMGCGIQPWRMPVDSSMYACVYHLGFRRTPDRPLHDFMAQSIGLPEGLPIEYEYPNFPLPEEPYIVLAARGETTYKQLFLDVMEKCPIKVIQIGGKGEAIGDDVGRTGLNMLETVSIISGAKAFIGLMSSQLVLANGFDIPKVAPHDGRSWDMRHVVKGPKNFYPINPSADEVLALALADPGNLIYSKSLHPIDYSLMSEPQHVWNTVNLLRSRHVPHRFEHHHRAWEYGIVLNALRSKEVKTILDVGGGGSVFAPAAMLLDFEVTEVDPGDVQFWIMAQSNTIQKMIGFEQQDFMYYRGPMADAVICISTLEHILDDISFFERLFDFAKKIVAITVDFSKDGLQKLDGHLRTYHKDDLIRLAKLARHHGFVPLGNKMDYDHFGEYVNNYSFASLILERV